MNGIDTPPGLAATGGSRARRWLSLRPPIDRPAGGRGPRALLAYLGVIAAVVAFPIGGFMPDPPWTEWAMKGAAVGMVVAAGLLWFARRTLGLALGLVLLAAGLAVSIHAWSARYDGETSADKWGGSVVSFSEHGRTAPLTPAEVAAVPDGATRAEVIGLLGQPIGHGIQRVVDEPDLRCIAYPADRFDPERGGHMHAFCFSDGRLVAQRDW